MANEGCGEGEGEGQMGIAKLAAITSTTIFSLSIVDARDLSAFVSGNALYEYCTSKSPFDNGLCTGYIEGISDALGASAILGSTVCVPSGVTVQQITDIVGRYLQGNPHLRHYAANGLVAAALNDAFPCSPNPQKK